MGRDTLPGGSWTFLVEDYLFLWVGVVPAMDGWREEGCAIGSQAVKVRDLWQSFALREAPPPPSPLFLVFIPSIVRFVFIPVCFYSAKPTQPVLQQSLSLEVSFFIYTPRRKNKKKGVRYGDGI